MAERLVIGNCTRNRLLSVEMDLCTIYLIEAKNCEADAPDGTIGISGDLARKIDRVAS